MALIAAAAIIGTIGAGKSTPQAFWNHWYTTAVVLGAIGLLLVMVPVTGVPKVSRLVVARDWWAYRKAGARPLWRAGHLKYGHALMLSLSSDRDPTTNQPPTARHIRVEVRTPVGGYYYDKSPGRPTSDQASYPEMSQFSKTFPELFRPDEGAPSLNPRSTLPRGRYFVRWYAWRDEGTGPTKHLLAKHRFKLKRSD